MAEAMLAIPIKNEIKTQAQAVFNDMGLDVVTAVNQFLEQIARREPACISIIQPAAMTLSSIMVGTPALLGGWEGKITMSDDFDAPLDDFEEYM